MARAMRTVTDHPPSTNGVHPPGRTNEFGAGRSVMSLSAPKRRRPSWVLFGGLLVGLATLLGAYVFATSTQRMSVIVAGRDLGPGDVVTATDLRVVEIGQAGGLRAIVSSQQTLIIGRAARGSIPAGTVLNTDLFTDAEQVIPVGMVVIGASLDPGAAPIPGLRSGDRVEVVGVVKSASSDQVPAVVLAAGTVWAVGTAGTSSSSKLWVSVLIPAGVQTAVAQAAADGRLRLSLSGAVVTVGAAG
jgi:SAF domain